jgi:hypothetical protein
MIKLFYSVYGPLYNSGYYLTNTNDLQKFEFESSLTELIKAIDTIGFLSESVQIQECNILNPCNKEIVDSG